MHYNTEPAAYVLNIAGQFRPADYPGMSPSHRIARVLQATDARIQTKGFRSAVLEAIFMDGVAVHTDDDDDHAQRLRVRLERRFGRKRARHLLIDRGDIFNTWRYRDAPFIPKAYLLATPNRTLGCY